MHLNDEEEAELDREMDEFAAGMIEAIQGEVETHRREGLPIFVERNGRIVDLQTTRIPEREA